MFNPVTNNRLSQREQSLVKLGIARLYTHVTSTKDERDWNIQGRIKLFGAPRQWKHFRPLFQAVFLSGGGVLPPILSQTPRLPVPRQK